MIPLYRKIITCLLVIIQLQFLSFSGASEKPNIIFILADDLGYGDLGVTGHPYAKSPNLDKLAETGMQFKTCYATPICHPTRFEIMTGQYGHHNKVYQFPGRRGGPVTG